jgi:hypothetical protein
MLTTSRPRGFRMPDDHTEDDASQGALFAPDSLAPAPRPAGPTPDPFAPPARPAPEAADAALAAPPDPTAFVPPGDDVAAAAGYIADPGADEPLAPADDLIADPEPAPRASRRAVPLAGPTLDDVMCRVWEGLRAEVPTPCPVCHTEIESSMHGRCGACGSALD